MAHFSSVVQVPYAGNNPAAYRKVARRNALLYIPTAEELNARSTENRRSMVAIAAALQTPLVVGVYAEDHRKAATQIALLADYGAAHALVFPPRIGTEMPTAFYRGLFDRLGTAHRTTVLLYDNNMNAVLGLGPSDLGAIAAQPALAGFVAASKRGRNLLNLLELRERYSGIAVFGTEAAALPALVLGVNGVIFQNAALYPHYAADLVQSAQEMHATENVKPIVASEQARLKDYLAKADTPAARVARALYATSSRFASPIIQDEYLKDFFFRTKEHLSARRLAMKLMQMQAEAERFAAAQFPAPGFPYPQETVELFCLRGQPPQTHINPMIVSRGLPLDELVEDDASFADAVARGNAFVAAMRQIPGWSYALPQLGPAENIIDWVLYEEICPVLPQALQTWLDRLADNTLWKAWRAEKTTARLYVEEEATAAQRGYRRNPFIEI